MATDIQTSLSVEEYLAQEEESTVKHEFVGGRVYSIVGATNSHNVIATNVLGLLWSKLRGKPCQAFNSDTKVRVELDEETRFYYPDVQVTCSPNSLQENYQEAPKVIVEVLAESTRRIDESEKRDAYLSIASLDTYILLEQDVVKAVVYRRTADGFDKTEYSQLSDTIALSSIECELQLQDIYAETDVSTNN